MRQRFIIVRTRIAVTLFLTVFAVVAFAQNAKPQWTTVLDATPAKMTTQLVSSSEESIKVRLQVPGFYTSTVTTPQGEAKVITVPSAVSTAHAGEPDVPMIGIPAAIGNQARMDIRVTEAKYMDFENIVVAPSKGDFPRTIDPATVPYTYGDCYNKDAFFPAITAELYEPYILRDYRGQNMAIHPFVYNPVTKTLRVYYDMTIEMYKVDDNGKNTLEPRRSNVMKVDPDFKSVYGRHFINYEAAQSKYTPVDEEGDLLIICYDQFINSMTDFVNWKRTRGVNTTIVGTSTAGTSYSAIKNYIQSQYNANNNLTHVLLVGDVAQIPGYSYSGGGSSYSGLGDNAYGQIVGNDIYNDVFIGRFSAGSVAQVTTQVNRVITYERDLTPSATWLEKAEGISRKENGSGHNGEDDYQHMDNIRTDLLNYGYNPVYQRYANLTGYDGSSSTISSDINGGVGIINYANHGQETAWGANSSGYIYYANSHVNALTNENKLPFIFSVACLVGKYDHSTDCFAEAWMRATNNNNPTGAIGTLMSYISQPWIPPMWAQDECIDILVGSYSSNIKHTWGGTAINGLMGIFDHYSTSEEQAVGTYQAWILYGDPSMMLRTKTPQMMTVTHPGTIISSATSYTVNVSGGEGALATITDANHNILGKATVNNGTAEIGITGGLTANSELTLCVFGYNKVTRIDPITVIVPEGPYIVLDSYDPEAVHVGEDIDLNLTFKNMGVEATESTTTVTLTSNNTDHVIVIDETETNTFDVLDADATTTVSGFKIHIAEGVADETPVSLHYSVVNGEKKWEGDFNVTAVKAILEYKGMTWDGGFEPGETLTVTAKFKNVGHYQATNAKVTASSTSGYISIAEPTVNVGTVDVDGVVTAEFSITISDNCPESELIPISFEMTADGGLTAQGEESLKNTCNVYFNLADSYGDGWNNAKLTVSFDDGTPSQVLTMNSGSTATYVLEIGNGTHVKLTWTKGNYDSECSFTVCYDGDGNLIIYQTSGTPSAGVLYEFDCNCAAATQIFTVTATSSNTQQGTVSGGGEYTFGQSCTVTATPAEGYMFTGWTVNGEIVSSAASYTFTVYSDMDLVAHFAVGTMIGDGGTATNDYLPTYSYYKYSLTEQIYTAEELGAAGTITSIAFYNAGAEKTRTLDLYLKNTTKTKFSSKTDWEKVNASDKVFSGQITMVANEWTFITFDTPFEYDGTSNVVLVTDDNSGSYTNSPHMSCRVFDASNQALYAYNDNTNFNPSSISSAGTLLSQKNQLIVTKEVSCQAPTDLAATEIGSDYVKLSWTENGKADEWIVAYGDQTITADTNEDFVLEELDPETTYSIKVRPSCDENLWSEAIEVTTLKLCPVPTNLSISDVTSISAIVSWEGEADSYELQYMPFVDNDANKDAIEWTTITNAVSPCTLSNLESGTSYVVKVKSVCGEHSESAWSQDVSFTTKDFVMGDVNGNGSVDIGDAVCIVNYLVNKQNVIFNTAAVDLNGNEQIDIGDAVMIVNILVGKDNDNNGETEAPAMNMEATERDPE